MPGSRHQVSYVSVHHWTNENTSFSLSGSEIGDCILLSMPEGTETRSWFKSCIFKGSFPPDVCINWETNWGGGSFEINQIPNGIRKLPPVHFLPLCQLLQFCFWHASFEISLKIVKKFSLTPTNNFQSPNKALIKSILHRRLVVREGKGQKRLQGGKHRAAQ